MAKLTRVTQPIFASAAAVNETSVFGTMKTSAQYTANIADSINTVAFTKGWTDAVELDYAPFVEDMNTVQRAITYQIAYNQQEGIPEWASDTTYYKGGWAKYNAANGAQIYESLVDNNVGNLVSDNTKWKLVLDTENGYVTTNTAQTITGAKTFSNDFSVLANSIKISSTGTNCNYPLSFQLPSFTKGDTPANNVIAGIDFYGSARTNFTDRLSNIDFMVDTSKNSSVDIRAYDCSSSASTGTASLSVHYDANGNTYALCPTPSLASNASNYSKQVVNVDWTTSNLVSLAGNQTISGAKTFTAKLSTASIELYPTAGGTYPYIDFHYNASSSDYTSRIREAFQNRLMIESGETILKSYGSGDGQLRIISTDDKYGMIFRSDGSNMWIFPTAQNDAYGSWDSTSKGLVIEASTGDVRAKGENGKGLVITDLGKTKSSNGYFKFSNGLIIAWGDFTYASGSGSVSVTLPTSMSSGSSYNVAVSFEGSRAHTGAVSSQTSTSFTFKSDSFESTGTANYIAIGY